MRDKTIPDVNDRKKIMFYDTADRQTRLRLRCEYDGINQSQFFRYVLTGYIENDPDIIRFVGKSKEKFMAQGAQKRKKILKTHMNSIDTKTKFNLDETEIENIFDIIEVETNL